MAHLSAYFSPSARCVSRGSELRTAELRLERILHGGRARRPGVRGGLDVERR